MNNNTQDSGLLETAIVGGVVVAATMINPIYGAAAVGKLLWNGWQANKAQQR